MDQPLPPPTRFGVSGTPLVRMVLHAFTRMTSLGSEGGGGGGDVEGRGRREERGVVAE